MGIDGPSVPYYIESISTLNSAKTSTHGLAELNRPIQLSIALQAIGDKNPMNFTLIVEVTNSNGTTEKVFIESDDWQSSGGATQSFSATWVPTAIGGYSVNSFVVSSSAVPDVLSNMMDFTVNVSEQVSSPPNAEVPASNHVPTLPAPHTNYTLLVYMVGSDLESESYLATQDIQEMMRAESSPAVSVVIETGGSLGAVPDDTRFIDFTKVQRFKISHDKFELLQDIGDKNMGDPTTLAGFLAWGKQNFPADKYIVSLWDHGAGINGFGHDNIYDSMLSLDDLKQAFSDSTGSKRFEVIGFDSCLMASIEVIANLAPYGNYLAASEEVEPGWGWNYTAVITSIENSPGQDGKSLGREIADSYMAYAAAQSASHQGFEGDRALTFSVIDLSQAPALVTKATTLGRYVEAQVRDISMTYKVEKSIQNSERYGIGASIASGHIDLYDFANSLGQRLGPGAEDVASDMMASLNKTVVYNLHGLAKPNSHGISIFVQTASYQPTQTALNSMLDGWLRGLDAMRLNLKPDVIPPEVALSQMNGGVIEGYVQADDLYKFTRMVLNETTDTGNRATILSYEIMKPEQLVTDKNGRVQFTWEKNAYFLCSGSSCIPASIYIDSTGSTTLAFIPTKIQSPSFNGSTILLYEVDQGQFVFLGAWSGIDSEGNASRDLIPLSTGDKIYTKFEEIDAGNSGYGREIDSGPIIVQNETSVQYKMQQGSYYMFVSACDFSGNCGDSNVFELR